MSMKSRLTPAGIEPATYRFVVQHLNLCYRGPPALVQYTFTHKQYTERHEQYVDQHNNFGRVQAVPRLCGFYPGICLTSEEKARKNLSQGSRIVPASMTKIHKHTIRIHRNNNKNT